MRKPGTFGLNRSPKSILNFRPVRSEVRVSESPPMMHVWLTAPSVGEGPEASLNRLRIAGEWYSFRNTRAESCDGDSGPTDSCP